MTFLVQFWGIFEESILATSLPIVRVISHILWTAYISALDVANKYCYIQLGEARGGTLSLEDLLHSMLDLRKEIYLMLVLRRVFTQFCT